MNEDDVRRLILGSELLPENEAVKCIAERSDAEAVAKRAIEYALKRGDWLLTHSLVDEILDAMSTERKAVEVLPERAFAVEFDAPAKRIASLVNVPPFVEKKSAGKVDDFVAYFRNRYSRVSDLLRSRVSNTASATIASLKASPSGDREVKRVVGMVFDKKETKNGETVYVAAGKTSTPAATQPSESGAQPTG
ncbi:MAG: hypothetical protein V1817_05010, partial [Candidatus Micrarchaeota archaeon]